MTKIAAIAALMLATFSTGCINMSTKRPSGGAQIQRTAPQADRVDPQAGSIFEHRADLGER